MKRYELPQKKFPTVAEKVLLIWLKRKSSQSRPPAVCRFRFVDLLVDLFKMVRISSANYVCIPQGFEEFSNSNNHKGGVNDCCEQLSGTSLHLFLHVH